MYKNLLHSYMQQQAIRKRNKENNPIYTCKKKDETPKDKLNKGEKRLVH